MISVEIQVVCRAIILDNQNRVLLGKRARGNGVGQWALVGGRPEGVETPEQTIVREVKEELGINFIPQFFKEYLNTTADVVPWQVIVFSGYFTGSVVPKVDEVSDVVFVTPALR